MRFQLIYCVFSISLFSKAMLEPAEFDTRNSFVHLVAREHFINGLSTIDIFKTVNLALLIRETAIEEEFAVEDFISSESVRALESLKITDSEIFFPSQNLFELESAHEIEDEFKEEKLKESSKSYFQKLKCVTSEIPDEDLSMMEVSSKSLAQLKEESDLEQKRLKSEVTNQAHSKKSLKKDETKKALLTQVNNHEQKTDVRHKNPQEMKVLINGLINWILHTNNKAVIEVNLSKIDKFILKFFTQENTHKQIASFIKLNGTRYECDLEMLRVIIEDAIEEAKLKPQKLPIDIVRFLMLGMRLNNSTFDGSDSEYKVKFSVINLMKISVLLAYTLQSLEDEIEFAYEVFIEDFLENYQEVVDFFSTVHLVVSQGLELMKFFIQHSSIYQIFKHKILFVVFNQIIMDLNKKIIGWNIKVEMASRRKLF